MSSPSTSPIRIAALNSATASSSSAAASRPSTSHPPASVGLRRKGSFPLESTDDLGSTATMTHSGFMAAMRMRDGDQSTVSGPKSLGSMMNFESEEYMGPAAHSLPPPPRPLQSIQSVLVEENTSGDREGGLGRGLMVQGDAPMPVTLGRPLKPSAKIGPLGSGPLLHQSDSDAATDAHRHQDQSRQLQDPSIDTTSSPSNAAEPLATSSNPAIHDPTSASPSASIALASSSTNPSGTRSPPFQVMDQGSILALNTDSAPIVTGSHPSIRGVTVTTDSPTLSNADAHQSLATVATAMNTLGPHGTGGASGNALSSQLDLVASFNGIPTPMAGSVTAGLHREEVVGSVLVGAATDADVDAALAKISALPSRASGELPANEQGQVEDDIEYPDMAQSIVATNTATSPAQLKQVPSMVVEDAPATPPPVDTDLAASAAPVLSLPGPSLSLSANDAQPLNQSASDTSSVRVSHLTPEQLEQFANDKPRSIESLSELMTLEHSAEQLAVHDGDQAPYQEQPRAVVGKDEPATAPGAIEPPTAPEAAPPAASSHKPANASPPTSSTSPTQFVSPTKPVAQTQPSTTSVKVSLRNISSSTAAAANADTQTPKPLVLSKQGGMASTTAASQHVLAEMKQRDMRPSGSLQSIPLSDAGAIAPSTVPLAPPAAPTIPQASPDQDTIVPESSISRAPSSLLSSFDADSLASLSSMGSASDLGASDANLPAASSANANGSTFGSSAPRMQSALSRGSIASTSSSFSSTSSAPSATGSAASAAPSQAGSGYSSFFNKFRWGGGGATPASGSSPKSRGSSPDASQLQPQTVVQSPSSPAPAHVPVPTPPVAMATPVPATPVTPTPTAAPVAGSASSSGGRGVLAAMAAVVKGTGSAQSSVREVPSAPASPAPLARDQQPRVVEGSILGDGQAAAMGLAPPPMNPGGISRSESAASFDDDVDWEFWGKVMQDYDAIARKHPKNLQRNVHAGIPAKIRGTVWVLMSGARDPDLEREFQRLLPLPSPFEKLIQRDLPRTFPGHEFFSEAGGPGQEALYNVVKAYSLYDPEVGYCQGIAFVAGPLLMNMPDEEAFCVLVKLLNTYNLRHHYTPHMDGLHLRMYQFDKLFEELMPHVYNHLNREGIKSTMYASQWFLTLFAYRFPLDLVMRVFDMIFAEGADVLLKISLALIKRHEQTLLTLEFENLLEYLKTGLFDYYTSANGHEFVQDALKMKITKRKLEVLAGEYENEVKLADGHLVMMETLKSENRRLEDRIKQLEKNLTLINQEHVDLANELIQTKVDYSKLKENNDLLAKQVAELRAMVLEERRIGEQRYHELMSSKDSEKDALKEQNDMLALQLQEMQRELVETKLKFAESEGDRDSLQKKLNQLKRAFDL